jgi:hypothetical protein
MVGSWRVERASPSRAMDRLARHLRPTVVRPRHDIERQQLFGLDAHELDHFGPLLGFTGYELTELTG